MDHHEIAEKDVLERYVQGRLNEQETLTFEAHLLECEECFEQVQWADDLGEGMRTAATQDLVRNAMQAGFLARLANLGFGQVMGWLVALFLVVAPSLLYLREQAHNRQLLTPQVNTPVFALGEVRDGSRSQVSLGDEPEWLVLTMALATAEDASYRATLLDAVGNEVWAGDDLIPDSGDRLVISFHSTLLQPGDYDLHIVGSTAQTGDDVFRFQVVR